MLYDSESVNLNNMVNSNNYQSKKIDISKDFVINGNNILYKDKKI